MAIEIRRITPSAHRHGINDQRIRDVVRGCNMPLYIDDPETGEDDLVLFFGPDDLANPLEVLAREHADGSVTVFHAMRVRGRYARLYRLVTGQR